MADVEIDLGAIYYGMRNVSGLISDLGTLSGNLANAVINDSEITTAHLISDAKAKVDSMKGKAQEVLNRLTNTKNILINSDREASYFFQFLETGVLDENFNFTEVPLYDQKYFNNVAYAGGTIASSGCGITSMCMALSYIFNDIITPEEMAGRVGGRSSLYGKMELTADKLGANWWSSNQYDHKDKFLGLLQEGKQVIISVNGGSHFVLISGYTDDGKFIVNDPYGDWQYDKPLTWGEINKASGYVWVVDPYKNVGNVKTNIGKIKVSDSVAQAIVASNNKGEVTKITNKTYLKNIKRKTAAQVANGSHIGPTALSLAGSTGAQVVNLRYSNDPNSGPLSATALATSPQDASATPTQLSTASTTDTSGVTTTRLSSDTGSTYIPTSLGSRTGSSSYTPVQTSSSSQPAVVSSSVSSSAPTPTTATVSPTVQTSTSQTISSTPVTTTSTTTTSSTPTTSTPTTTSSTPTNLSTTQSTTEDGWTKLEIATEEDLRSSSTSEDVISLTSPSSGKSGETSSTYLTPSTSSSSRNTVNYSDDELPPPTGIDTGNKTTESRNISTLPLGAAALGLGIAGGITLDSLNRSKKKKKKKGN